MTVTLDSFLDRLGLEGDMRLCVLIAFAPDEGGDLPGEQATACLGWVAAVQEGKMVGTTFRTLLESFLTELGNPPNPDKPEELETVAKCMLSGHVEPAESDK